jgi:hypothetical protein
MNVNAVQVPLRTAATQDAGLFGGDGFQQVYGLAFAPSNSDRVYASIDYDQIWRSNDGGFMMNCRVSQVIPAVRVERITRV